MIPARRENMRLTPKSLEDEKHRREFESMQYIVNELLKPISEEIANDFMDLWMEYEAGETPEAIFVKDGKPHCTTPSREVLIPALADSGSIRAHLSDDRIREEI